MNITSQALRRSVAALYWLIVALLILLNPWGSIDTRDFSYMGPLKFWEYNAYITLVLAGMIVLGIVLWRKQIGAATAVWMGVINTAYIVMILFDLLHFFPDPAQPLAPLTAAIEIMTASIALGILACVPRLSRSEYEN